MLYISINLIGFLVRGFFTDTAISDLEKTGSEFVKGEIIKNKRTDIFINIFALILNLLFLIILYRYWNIGVMAVAIVMMIMRIPDLIWEIRYGGRLSLNDTRTMPKDLIYFITGYSWLLEFPLLYYSLHYL